jgi:catechol 2,3-dioxygenase-like lactoylglutathione lyase family enzyme
MNEHSAAESTGSEVVRAILETVVYAEDLDASRSFYRDVIGLTLVSQEPGRHLFFRVGQSMLLVFNPMSTRQATVHVGDQVIPQHGPSGPSHFAFEVDRSALAIIKTRLAEHGFDIESEINWPGGGHSIYCRDPAGNSVEFATRDLWFSSGQE